MINLIRKVTVTVLVGILLLPGIAIAIPDNIAAPPPPNCESLNDPNYVLYLISLFPGNQKAIEKLISNYESICETQVILPPP